MKWIVFFSVVVVFTAIPTFGESVDLSRSIESGGSVRVDISYGHIRVVGSESGQVRVRGTTSSEVRGVSLSQDAGAIEVRVRYPLFARLWAGFDEPSTFDVDLVIEVPDDTRLFVVAKDADLEIEGIRGPVGVGVVSSSVVIRGEPSRLNFEAVSGSLDFEGQTSNLLASTLSGDLFVVGADGQIELEAATGALTLLGARPFHARLNTVSGDISISAAVEEGGHVEVETQSGEVKLECCDLRTSFDIATQNGEILNEATNDQPIRGERGQRRLEVSPGGSSTARIRTRSGLIWLLPNVDDVSRFKTEFD